MKLQMFILFAFVALCKSSAEDLSEEGELFERRLYGNKINRPGCVRHTDCETHEYCLTDKFGFAEARCHNKQQDTAFCRMDFECLSNHCHWKRCKGIAFKNIERGVRCQKSDDDCNHNQRCEQHRCVDKKKIGWCAFDSDCFSNHCNNFKCVYRASQGWIRIELEWTSEWISRFKSGNYIYFGKYWIKVSLWLILSFIFSQ